MSSISARSIFKDEYLLTETQNWDNWRTKSLNSGSLERYSLPITPKTIPGPTNEKKGPEQETASVKHTPKIIKINENIFCVLLNNTLTIFSYLDENEREKKKVKTRFIKILIEDTRLPHEIEWVFGDGSQRIYVGSEKEIVVLGVKGNPGKQIESITQLFRKQITNIKAMKTMVSNMRKYFVVLTKQTVMLFDIDRNYELIRELPISFSEQSSGWNDLSKINGISLIASSLNVFYFFGTSVEQKADVRHKLGREEDKNEPVKKKCEALYLTKIQIHDNGVDARVFIIDHIFEIGIFKKSRVHQVGNQTFLLSLYQEIIVIRRNFSKFMVWDNVSIVSSKSNQKKGQLVLADKRIMVYTQNTEISAYELFFNFEKAKLQTPKIDSFKGNGNEEQILYQALILQYKQKTYMKVLFYFKQMQVYIPNRKVMSNTEESAYHPAAKNELFFQIMCIQQTEPTEKLKEYLQKNRAEEIQSFLKRFHINELTYKKSEWEVSAKGQKQIEALLLNIKDNQYIQSELTKILKSKPHDLLFLIAIQKKQIERYRTMIASKLLLNEQYQNNMKENSEENLVVHKLSEFLLLRQVDEVKLAIQWLLESKMFYKKLQYSLSFMSFKQYDFIDIGKLRAASLREEIKLLGVKGYEKRLKYFFNSFKYLVLDDFKQIIKFVISDLTQNELRNFFSKSFPFILPSYRQLEGEDRCKLWDDTFNQDQLQIETIKLFCKQVEEEMQKISNSTPNLRMPLSKAIEAFNQLFVEFRSSAWFIQNSYKQHSLLHHSIQELKSLFSELKRNQVFNMIIQFAYQKIGENKFNEKKVKEIIQNFKKDKYLTQDYVFNIDARLEVYQLIVLKVKIDRKRYLGFGLPPKSKFIIMKESQLFQLLFENFAEHLVNIIKDIYETKRKGLFLENFNKYLNSSLPNLESLIQFMTNFRQNENEEIRKQIFNCICKMMQITDVKNSSNLISKIASMPVLQKSTKQKLNAQKLVAEAKVCFANYFSPLFNKFNLSNTYAELIAQTECNSLDQAKILKELISTFIKQYVAHPHRENIIEFPKSNMISQHVSNVDLCEIIDFLSILLYFHSMMDYRFENVAIFKSVIIGFVEAGKFEHISEMIEEILEFGKMFDDRDLIERYGNYRVFNQFKIQTSIKKQFQNCILDWIDGRYSWLVSLKYQPIPNQLPKLHEDFENQEKQHKYQAEKQIKRSAEFLTDEVMKQTFFYISSVLKILNFYSTGQNIQFQISRVGLFSAIKVISPNLLSLLLPSLILEKQKYKTMSSFKFMTILLHKINEPSPTIDSSTPGIDNKQIFTITRRQQVLELLSNFNKVHKQYINVFHAGKKKNEEIVLGQLCRFNAEFVMELMGWGFPRVAIFVLLDLINSTYYYKDIFFNYLASMSDSHKVTKKEMEKIVYQFIAIDNPLDLKKILNAYVVNHDLNVIVPPAERVANVRQIFTEILANNQLDQAFYFCMRNVHIPTEQFQDIALSMNKFREDHVLAQGLLVSFIRAVKERMPAQNWPTLTLYQRKINCMMRPLERMEIIKDIIIMLGQLEIEELKKKISQTGKPKQSLMKEKNNQNQSNFQKLRKQYEKYMQAENLNPWLTINNQQIQLTATRLQKYPDYSEEERKSKDQYYKTLPIIREEESHEVKELRKKLFENQQKLKDIQQANRLLMEEQIVPAITQVKLTAEREHLSLIQRKKKKKEEEQKEKQRQAERQKDKEKEKEKTKQKEKQKAKIEGEQNIFQKPEKITKQQKQLEKLEIEQKQKVEEVKKTYSSKIIQQTQELINELRERRKKVKQQTAVTFTSDEPKKKVEQSLIIKIPKPTLGRLDKSILGNIDETQSPLISSITSPLAIGLKDKDKLKASELDGRKSFMQSLDLLKNSHLKNTTIDRLIADRNGEFYVPRWEQKNPLRLQFEEMMQEKPKKSQVMQKMKKQMAEEVVKQKEKADKEKTKKITIEDLIKKYKLLNQPYTSEMIQKISVVLNNPKACTQIIKNLYLEMKESKNFIQLCKDLLVCSDLARQFIEQKAIKIAQQSSKTKVSIPIKQIFPSHFFTSIHSTALRDYYPIAYTTIRPNLLKLMQQPNYNVNSLAMMIRFGFGSDTSYYYRVYEDYMQSMLENYETKSSLLFTDKDLMQLAEKLRANYSNLSPSNKKNKFEQLIHDIKSVSKRKALIRALLVNLENKSTMVNKQSYEELRIVLVKLEDANAQLT